MIVQRAADVRRGDSRPVERPRTAVPGTTVPGAARPRDAAASPVQFSIVVPLYDCRDAGSAALESALAQTFARNGYEVIAVADPRTRHAWPDALFARCDHIVAVDADFRGVESEIALFAAGSRFARGEWLYFIEGHTVLDPDALCAIDRALRRQPDCVIACGRRANHAKTRLGLLVGGNNDVHEARASRRGNFTLGANCVIRRSTFVGLGGFEPRLLRFNETVLYERALDAGLRIGAIDAILCTHHNDTGFRWLVRLLVATGRAKARHYARRHAGTAEQRASTTQERVVSPRPRLRHPVYRWLDSTPAALASALPLRIAGPALILLAMALVRGFPACAQAVYRWGVGCTDVSGFCAERSFRGSAARSVRADVGDPPIAAVVRRADGDLPVDPRPKAKHEGTGA